MSDKSPKVPINPKAGDPQPAEVDLLSILLLFPGKSQERMREIGFEWYQKLYLTEPGKVGYIGIHELQNQERVLFHRKTFDHAFYKSSNYKLHQRRKDVIDCQRLQRVRWIGPLISGLVENSSCWEVTSLNGRPGLPNRAYVSHTQKYVVWLEARANSPDVTWKFMSAFPVYPDYIMKKVMVGNRIWRRPPRRRQTF